MGGAGGELAGKLEALAGIGEAGLVFGDPGPPVDLTADYVCFHIPGLRLPARGSVREELLPEELIGQAVLYLVAAFSRRVLFRHPDRFAALLLDEAHALTGNPQGRALIGDLIRDGRKHFAAVWAFSQLPADFTTGDERDGLDALLGYRVVFRQSQRTAADALRFLGSDARDDNLDTVTAPRHRGVPAARPHRSPRPGPHRRTRRPRRARRLLHHPRHTGPGRVGAVGLAHHGERERAPGGRRADGASP